ncbi:MAG: metal ABC transporter ATP-binding protein, partial [Actinomycetota bacterium]
RRARAAPGPPPPSLMGAAVTARDLAVGYAGHAVVEGIDLDVPAGTWVSVVGTNGCGKSTLLKTVVGLLPPVHGALAVLDGAPGAAPRRVAYLAQSRDEGFLLPLRARDLVRMGRYSVRGLLGRLRDDDHAAVRRAMRAVGIDDLADLPLGRLSGGQQQRVHLAQALARDAALIVLDEPTSGLDAASRALYRAVVREECARGATVVAATHDVTEAAQADLVLLLAQRVVAAGPPGEVLTAANLLATFGVVISELPEGLLVMDPDHQHQTID